MPPEGATARATGGSKAEGATGGPLAGWFRERSRAPVVAEASRYPSTVAVRVVRLGSPRQPGEGIRLGTVRYPPRGVPKAEWAARDFFDVWLPELAPGAEAIRTFRERGDWGAFSRTYRKQLREPPARHLIELLAALSHTADLSVGCFCEDESRCHRSILADELLAAGAEVDR